MPNDAVPASRREHVCVDSRYESADPVVNCVFVAKPILSCAFHTALKKRNFAVVSGSVELLHPVEKNTARMTGNVDMDANTFSFIRFSLRGRAGEARCSTGRGCLMKSTHCTRRF